MLTQQKSLILLRNTFVYTETLMEKIQHFKISMKIYRKTSASLH